MIGVFGHEPFAELIDQYALYQTFRRIEGRDLTAVTASSAVGTATTAAVETSAMKPTAAAKVPTTNIAPPEAAMAPAAAPTTEAAEADTEAICRAEAIPQRVV
ncbi:MAG: hypothetical protein JWM91_102, partial [Rhodospirillales bacterium]|nr:hypothetical protein [Rhodospirillales bacterium]